MVMAASRKPGGAGMRRFWDARAKENAFYFIDNRLRYHAPDVDRFWAEGKRDLEHVLNALDLEIDSTMVVVDIGCGVGRLTRPLSARAARVLGIDVSEEMLARARELNRDLDNVQWLRGDGTSLSPIRDSSVDACISHVVFQHIPDPAVILGYVREMGRVLRRGGWAAFVVSNDPRAHGAPPRVSILRWLRVLARRGPRGQSDPRWRGAPVGIAAVRVAADDAGMTLERILHPGTQFCLLHARRRR
jgi:SAM-dependent methyltransferase